MKLFKDLTDNTEDMMEFKKKQDQDDENLKKYFMNCTHKELVSSIMHLGTLFDTVAVYFHFLDVEAMINANGRDRKINKALNDLNKKINLEYEFDDNIAIVEEGVLYDGEIYLFINKCQFVKTMQLKEL